MKASEYINEVKSRLQRFVVSNVFSDMDILTYINKARHEIQRQILSILPYRFSRISEYTITPVHLEPRYKLNDPYNRITVDVFVIPIPDDVIDIEVLYLIYKFLPDFGNPNVEWRRAVRKLAKYEFFSGQMHSWNFSSVIKPTFSLEKVWSDNNIKISKNNNRILLTGLNTSPNFNLLSICQYVKLESWETVVLPYIENIYQDDEDSLPLEFCESVVLYAVYQCLIAMGNKNEAQAVMMTIQQMIERTKALYDFETIQKPIWLPSKEGENV